MAKMFVGMVLGSHIRDTIRGSTGRLPVLIAVLAFLLFPGMALAVSTVPLSGTLDGDVLVNHLNVQSDNLSVGWNLSSAEMTISFDKLTVDNGTDVFQFTDGEGILLADNTVIDAEGKGRFTLYSNRLSGLSFGGTWDGVNASVKGGVLRIDGREIDILQANISGKNVQTVDPDFSSRAGIALENGSLLLGHARGTVSGMPVDLDLTYEGFNGTVDVSTGIKDLTTGLKDRVVFSGSAGKLLMVEVTPGYVLADPGENVSYNFTVYSEAVKNASIDVEAPPEWQVIVEDARIILTPPVGTAPWVYQTGITAKADGMAAAKPVETEIRTVRNVSTYLLNASSTAFAVSFVNYGNVDEVLSLNLTGGEGLAILGRDTVELPAGGAGSVSLVFGVDWSIPAGEKFPFKILYRSEDGVINGNASGTFVMPAVYGADVEVEPDEVYGIPGRDIVFSLTAISRSNVNETYVISMDLPENWTADFIESAVIDMGMSAVQEVTVFQNASTGSYNITIEITSTTSNLSTKRMLGVKIVDPITMASWEAKMQAKNAMILAESCGPVVIASYLSDLAILLDRLEETPDSSTTKEEVANTIVKLAEKVEWVSPAISGNLSNISKRMENNTGQNLVEDLQELKNTLDSLSIELQSMCKYRPELWINNSAPDITWDVLVDPARYKLKDDVQKTVRKSLEWLPDEAQKWQNAKRCYGCHVQSQAIEGMSISRYNGYAINEDKLTNFVNYVKNGQRNDGSFHTSATHPRRATTSYAASSLAIYDRFIGDDAFVSLKKAADYLIPLQYADGHWDNEYKHPAYSYIRYPFLTGNTRMTAQIVVILSEVYDRTGDTKYLDPRNKAISWLKNQSSTWTDENAMTLIALKRSGLPDTDTKVLELVTQLLSEQKTDGGWGLAGGRPTNPYSTGEVVYSLKLAGKNAFDENVTRGLRWLINTQNADGSWNFNQDTYTHTKYAGTMNAVIGLGNIFIIKCTSLQTRYFNLTLTNEGDTNSTYVMNVTGLPGGWNISIENNVFISAGESINLTLGITPPENVTDGIYDLSVTAMSLNDTRARDHVTGTPIVLSLCETNVNLKVQPKSNTVTPLEPASYNITLKNWNNESGNYDLSIEGLPEEWYNLSTKNITVEGDSSWINVALASRGAIPSAGGNPSVLNDGRLSGYAYCTWPCSMTITLPETYNISKTKTLLYDLDDRFYKYKIETSLDGINWELAVNKTTGEWRSWQTDGFSTREARYLKITGTHSSIGTDFRFEAYQPSVPPEILNLTVTPPRGAIPDKYVFAVYAVSNPGNNINNTNTTIAAVDYVELNVESGAMAGGVNLTVVPALAYIEKEGKFQVTVENTGRVKTIYNISVDNLPSDWHYDSLENISLLPGQYKNFYLTLHPGDITPRANPIVSATSIKDGNITDSENISAIHLEVLGVSLSLNPPIQKSGQGNPTRFNATITNTGKIEDTYNLSIDLPAGWNYTLSENEITLTPFIFNTRNVTLAITPPTGTQKGEYNFTIQAASKNYSFVNSTVTGTANVTLYGIDVRIDPKSISSSPSDPPIFNVTITNTGENNDTYRLDITSLSGKFGSNEIFLTSGESKNTTLLIENTTYALQQTYPFEVLARSTTEPDIMDSDSANINFTGLRNVNVIVFPDTHNPKMRHSLSWSIIQGMSQMNMN